MPHESTTDVAGPDLARGCTIRPASYADCAQLHALARITFPLACTPQTPRPAQIAFVDEHLSASAFERYVADRAHHVWVADDQAAGLIGFTMVVLGEPADPDVAAAIRLRPSAELSKMYVHPDHHGTGAAARLVTAAATAAREAGAVGLWLGVSEENGRANAFYAKHGFEHVGTKRFRIGDLWEDDNVRERHLLPGQPARD